MPLLGPELLVNGDFEASSGFGQTSVIGPGWTSQYCVVGNPAPPCFRPPGNNLFSGSGSGGSMAYFTTNAGQVTGGDAAAIPALGARSLAVNVGQVTTVPIIQWSNIPMVNGQSYRLQVSAAIIYAPFGVAVKINGGVDGDFQVSSPTAARQWQTTTTDFMYAGPTGNQSVGLFSNSAVFGGNDHTFDDISLRTLAPDLEPCECCPVSGAVECYDAGVAGNGNAVSMVCDGELTWFDIETGIAIPVDATIGVCP